MLAAHPRPAPGNRDAVVRCIEACDECATTCTSCADACLAESDLPDMVRCIRLCLDCADVCGTTSRVVTRQTEADAAAVREIVEACLAACATSRAECERHAAHHEHCRICAEVCARCEQACGDLLAELR
jgi:Domain of Unknown Function (DUF326)